MTNKKSLSKNLFFLMLFALFSAQILFLEAEIVFAQTTCGPALGIACNPVDNASDFYDVIVIAIRYLLSLIALITLLYIVISGIKYLTSFGNEEKMRSAKEGLASAIFGLALALMAYAILEVIVGILNG